MICPKCKGKELAVSETTQHEDSVYRRRYCKLCMHKFKTKEDVFTGIIPQLAPRKRLTDPKEGRKTYDTSTLGKGWRWDR